MPRSVFRGQKGHVLSKVEIILKHAHANLTKLEIHAHNLRIKHAWYIIAEIVYTQMIKVIYTRDFNFIIHMGQVIIHAGKYFDFLCNLNSIFTDLTPTR